MLQEKTLVLNNLEVSQKLNRVAFEILEDNYQEEAIYLLALESGGVVLSEKLKTIIQANSKIDVQIVRVKLDKAQPVNKGISLDVDIEGLKDKVVILVDDVANTGKVLTFAMKPLLNVVPKKIRAMVLVDRRHKKYPITPDFIGLSLATTMQEHISVQVDDNNEIQVYLN